MSPSLPTADPPAENDPGEIFVKICGITTEADALLAVGMGAAAVGFVFAPSPRQMSPTAVGDIVKRLPREIVTVGVFRDEAPQRVIDIANHLGLRAVQLHGMESAEHTRWITERVGLTIKAFPAGHPRIVHFTEYGAQLLMIDGASPGSGELFDWRLAEGVVDPRRLIVSGGLRPENVGAAIAHLHPWGVDVCSGVEASPGVKDPVKLRQFIAAAHAAAEEVAISERAGMPPRGTSEGQLDAEPGSAVPPGPGPAEESAALFDWQSE